MLTNCAPITLLQYLKENVTDLVDESANNLKLFVLSDEYNNGAEEKVVESFMDYTPKRFKDEFLARKHLILIYQGAQIVIGMSTFEYAYCANNNNSQLNWSRGYIQYVDTTGLFTPRQNQSHLTRSLVKSYLTYCKDVLNMGSVHLLATAKPAFLFAGSEFIEGKRALPAVKLINWWIGLIQDFAAKSEKCKVFVYSPAEEAEGSTRMKKRISGFDGWTYGLPYASSLPCVDQVPLFEDDPKWRHFEATILDDDELLEEIEKKSKKRPRIIDEEVKNEQFNTVVTTNTVSVKEFFESIQIRPEFRSDPSCFFVLQFPKRIKDNISNDFETEKLKISDLASFGIKMLSGLTFESEANAKISSQKISGWLKLMAVPSVEIRRVEKDEKRGKENVENQQIAVNSLQSLIKKKPLKQ